MFVFIGVAVVLGSVVGGYVLEGGILLAIYQPIEILIIFGAAIGALIIATPLPVIKGIIAQIKGILGAGYAKQDYLDLLVMMFEIFNIARKDGLIGLESHVENPKESDF